jgi:alcohol dehydrogenase class IV
LHRLKKDKILKNFVNSPFVTFEFEFGNNPSLVDLQFIASKYYKKNIKAIIGLGGGSSMDAAKISSISIPAYSSGKSIQNLLDNKEILENVSPIKTFQVPTTAGTGSEVTPFATVWDYDLKIKKSLHHKNMYADTAYIDPDFLIDLPLNVALATGLDALNQAFESIWNVNATQISQLYAIKAAQLSLSSLKDINIIKHDPEVRKNLATASMLAGLAISQTRTAICHSISYPLTLRFGLPHGLACAFSMLAVYSFNKSYIIEQLSLIDINIDNVYSSIENIFNMYDLREIILSYIKSPLEVISMLPEMISSGRFENNIRNCTNEDLKNIIDESIEYFMETR